MKLLVNEYFDVVLTIICGLIIISIVIGSILRTNIDINHFESINNIYPIIEKIDVFECKDVPVINGEYDLFKDVVAISNSKKDIKNNVVARIKEDNNKKYVEYVLKYNNDFKIKKAKLIIMEDDNNENNV